MKQHIMMDPGSVNDPAELTLFHAGSCLLHIGGHTGDGQASSGAKFLATTISTAFFPGKNRASSCSMIAIVFVDSRNHLVF